MSESDVGIEHRASGEPDPTMVPEDSVLAEDLSPQILCEEN